MNKETKKNIINEFMLHNNDCGSTEIQIAVLTQEIRDLTEHLKIHKKDFHSCYGLIKKVSKRKKILNYLKKNNINKYKVILEKLKIRK